MLAKHSRNLRLSALLGVALYSSISFAWNADAPFQASVHDHVFDRAVLSSNDCTVDFALYFTAPSERYENPVATKNYYRFHARLRFEGGHQPRTLVFGNRASGRRVYRTQIDTSADGCWAKSKQKLFGVDVEGCRGRQCRPDEFE
jgi:hypothetical protein